MRPNMTALRESLLSWLFGAIVGVLFAAAIKSWIAGRDLKSRHSAIVSVSSGFEWVPVDPEYLVREGSTIRFGHDGFIVIQEDGKRIAYRLKADATGRKSFTVSSVLNP